MLIYHQGLLSTTFSDIDLATPQLKLWQLENLSFISSIVLLSNEWKFMKAVHKY